MDTLSETSAASTTSGTDYFDVIIVGAGISGIGSAYHLKEQSPERSFVILESMEGFGGTWRTHRYPGVRSDSDLYTFGYRFKPWTNAPIASSEEIQKYLADVIDENDLARHIRYSHHIDSASWDSNDKIWTVEVTRADTGEKVTLRTNFLWMCQGYYKHEQGYVPEWPGFEKFRGRVIHPQTWPEDVDLSGKNVLVIGSGATAATLVPAIANDCAHLTMLQRSPTYFFSRENKNELADTLRELEIPEEWIHEIVRRKVLSDLKLLTQLSLEQPEWVRTELINAVARELPEGFDVEKHFTPKYRPWQQRLALIPEGDMFKVFASGQASMVTDEIDHFTENGVVVRSGDEITADVIITATGFELQVLGGIKFTVDSQPVDFAQTVSYRGMMFTGVPNLVWIMGYWRASWTLRVDLIGDFVARLLAHMDELHVRSVTPQLREQDADAELEPWIDPANFNPGYIMRSMHLMPKRIDLPEWRHTQDYWLEREELPSADLDDGCLRYS
jgi:cation diffusion facilitator CzcD-associated flavoprotein CzcO